MAAPAGVCKSTGLNGKVESQQPFHRPVCLFQHEERKR